MHPTPRLVKKACQCSEATMAQISEKPIVFENTPLKPQEEPPDPNDFRRLPSRNIRYSELWRSRQNDS